MSQNSLHLLKNIGISSLHKPVKVIQKMVRPAVLCWAAAVAKPLSERPNGKDIQQHGIS